LFFALFLVVFRKVGIDEIRRLRAAIAFCRLSFRLNAGGAQHRQPPSWRTGE
jgi:hypothetical protein